MVTQLY